jgi:hypothetical protein
MDAAGEGAAGAGGAADAGAAGGADGAGNPGGAAGAGGAAAAGSVLAAGAQAAAGAASTEFIPEKYRVAKEDGTLDLEASSRKLAEAYGHAEKRIGSGDVPPKTAEEYQVTVPDAFKETWNPEQDDSFKEFRGKALEAGMTQKQLDLVMGQYFAMLPHLAGAKAEVTAESATAELQKTWATEADFKRNVTNALTGAQALAQKSGISMDEIMSPGGLGNNPLFLKLMAAIGPEFREDTAPGGGTSLSAENVDDMMRSEAYRDQRHKDHAKVSEQIRQHFIRKHGTEAAA